MFLRGQTSGVFRFGVHDLLHYCVLEHQFPPTVPPKNSVVPWDKMKTLLSAYVRLIPQRVS